MSKFLNYFIKNSLIKRLKRGIIIFSKIIEINKKFFILDSNLKSESYIPKSEFYNDYCLEKKFKIGDFVETILIKIDNGFGYTVLSRKLFYNFYNWKLVKFIFKNKLKIKCNFLIKLKDGIYFEFKGIKCFLSKKNISKILFKNFDSFSNKHLYRIISFNFKKKIINISLILSLLSDFYKNKKNILIKIKKTNLIKGVVKNLINNFYCIDFGYFKGYIFKKKIKKTLFISQFVLLKLIKKNKKFLIFNLPKKKFFLNFLNFIKFARIIFVSNFLIKLLFFDKSIFLLKRNFNKKFFKIFLNKININSFVKIYFYEKFQKFFKFKILKFFKFKPSLA